MSYVSQQFIALTNTSDATFRTWAKAVSDALASMGWLQQNDTGQAVFAVTTLTFTQVTVGANAVYSYSSFTGPVPRVGMSVAITGFVNGGNNVTATLTAVSGGASGTVTVALTTQTNETHAGTGVTTLSVTPGAGLYVYEIWKPGDGGTTFYLKVAYGTSSSACNLRMSLGTTTDGAGTLTGFTVGPWGWFADGGTTNNATAFEWNFSGDTNRFCMMVARNHTSNVAPSIFAIERIKNTDGTDSSEGVTLWVLEGVGGNINSNNSCYSAALVFGVGGLLGPATGRILPCINIGNTATIFNNNIAVSPVFPFYGKFGPPHTVFAFAYSGEIAEGCIFTVTLYGETRTYLYTTKVHAYLSSTAGEAGIGMRFD